MSGCASDMAGIDWLQSLLGPRYRVIPVALKSNVLHLDCALALVNWVAAAAARTSATAAPVPRP